MRMTGEFIERFRGFDIIVMNIYNFMHPKLLVSELNKLLMVLDFIAGAFHK